MATIKLTDSSALEADAVLLDNSVLGKTPNSVLHFLRSDVIGALVQTLDKVQIDSVSMGFSYQPAISLSGGTASFTAGGDITGEVDLYKPGKAGSSSPLFPPDQYGATIEMGTNCYLSLGLQVAASGEGDAAPGAFTLTLTGGASASAKLYLPFGVDSTGAYPTLKAALETLGGAFTLPSTIAAMKALPTGAVFVYDAKGSVGFDAEFDVLAAVNPTASLGVSSSYGPIKVSAGPAVTVGGGFSLSGDFQVRMWNKTANVVQLSYHKKQGCTFNVTFDASVAADVSVGSYDVFTKIYGLLGSAGELDAGWLKANIPAAAADDVQAAYQAAVQTKLSIAIDEECDTSITTQVAFSWEFDTTVAGSDGVFTKAIAGDLTSLMSGAAMPPGVTKVGSVFDKLKTAKHTFTFNFLGLYDYADVQSASLQMTVKVAEDGQVVIADTASLSRLSATTTPLIKSALLRKVLAEDFIATVGYSTSLGRTATDLKVSYSYYDYETHTHVSDLQLFLSAAAALTNGTAPAQEWNAIVQAGMSSQSASLLASLTYDNPAAIRLFLDGTSAPRSVADYQSVGRRALVLTPGLNLGEIFVAFLQDDSKWQLLLDAGAIGNFYSAMGVSQTPPPEWATVAYAWKQHVVSWAGSMHSAAQALQNVLQYLAQHAALDPVKDADFQKLRKVLASQLMKAVQAAPLFNDALGVVTIFLAAPPASTEVTISYGGKTATYA
jgi:hypothetical protein